MNNLKFRAYIKSINKVVDVLKIDFKSNTLLLDIDSDEMIPKSDYWWYETTLNFEDVEIMQSTGLFDKNGVEIFEDDIVNCGYLFTGSPFEEEDDYTEDIGVIKIVNCGAVVKINGDFECLVDVLNNCEDFEVIGNIYENKELLK